MHYRELPPSPPLAAYVRCFWSLSSDSDSGADPQPQPVVPDGCVEIVFNLADRFCRYLPGGTIEIQPRVLVAGQIENNVVVAPSGDVRLFGIRFTPGGAFPFFDFPMFELNGRIESIETVWAAERDSVYERIEKAVTFVDAIAAAESFLISIVKDRSDTDPLLQRAINLITGQNGTCRIRSVADAVGISERGLERRFKQYVGLSPKSYSRIVRFQSVLRALEEPAAGNVIDAAYLFGFYDQSHIINDFQQFSGMSPTMFLDRTQGQTDLFRSAA